jgi:hypothetical protein
MGKLRQVDLLMAGKHCGDSTVKAFLSALIHMPLNEISPQSSPDTTAVHMPCTHARIQVMQVRLHHLQDGRIRMPRVLVGCEELWMAMPCAHRHTMLA